jgi:cAMP-dependent protein kinase regulator
VSSEASNVDDGPFEKKVFPKSAEAKGRLCSNVRRNILFSHLDEDLLNDVVDAFFSVKVAPGDVVIKQGEGHGGGGGVLTVGGDVGDNFYIVDEGECDIYVAKGGGEAKLVFTARAGNAFGELALMYNCPRAATVIVRGGGGVLLLTGAQAKTPSTLWALDRVTFQRIQRARNSDDRKQYERFLVGVPILASMSRDERIRLADVLEARTYEDGEAIIRQGEPGEHFFILVEGQAGVFKRTGGGAAVKVMDIRKGGYFGERALITNEVLGGGEGGADGCSHVLRRLWRRGESKLCLWTGWRLCDCWGRARRWCCGTWSITGTRL